MSLFGICSPHLGLSHPDSVLLRLGRNKRLSDALMPCGYTLRGRLTVGVRNKHSHNIGYFIVQHFQILLKPASKFYNKLLLPIVQDIPISTARTTHAGYLPHQKSSSSAFAVCGCGAGAGLGCSTGASSTTSAS